MSAPGSVASRLLPGLLGIAACGEGSGERGGGAGTPSVAGQDGGGGSSDTGALPGGGGSSGGDASSGGHGGAPFIEIGTGTVAFEPLTPGQEVPLVAGPQGGYHVWGALEAGGINPQGVLLHFTLEQDGHVVGEANYRDDLYRITPGGPLGYTRVTVVLIENDPASVAPRAALLKLEVTPEGGATLTDEVEIIPVCCQHAPEDF